jgi:hypothetical protein
VVKSEGKRPLGRPRRLRIGTSEELLWMRRWTFGFLRHGVSFRTVQRRKKKRFASGQQHQLKQKHLTPTSLKRWHWTTPIVNMSQGYISGSHGDEYEYGWLSAGMLRSVVW